MAAAAARLRKGALLDAARRALREPSLVAVGALLKADVPACLLYTSPSPRDS